MDKSLPIYILQIHCMTHIIVINFHTNYISLKTSIVSDLTFK